VWDVVLSHAKPLYLYIAINKEITCGESAELTTHLRSTLVTCGRHFFVADLGWLVCCCGIATKRDGVVATVNDLKRDDSLGVLLLATNPSLHTMNSLGVVRVLVLACRIKEPLVIPYRGDQ
jgi:hypothetical protein